ncbi:MAG: hypothetical protein IPK66_00765 [Rhodospirillales bacterium]|nr:hypothetical protein [Rhodospirillales bacterium]
MSRILLQYLLPLLLPTAIWLLWYLIVGRRTVTADGSRSVLYHGPWFWLFLGGVCLLGVSLVFSALTQGYDPIGRYVAPHWENGRVVPGRVE